jgi:hypothetical protein
MVANAHTAVTARVRTHGHGNDASDLRSGAYSITQRSFSVTQRSLYGRLAVNGHVVIVAPGESDVMGKGHDPVVQISRVIGTGHP